MYGIKQKKWVYTTLALVLVIQLCFGLPGAFDDNVFADKPEKVKLDIPSNIQVSATVDEIIVKWDPVAKAESYTVEINGSVTEGITANEYTFTGLEPNTEYGIKVRAVNKNSISQWSETLIQKTLDAESVQTENPDGTVPPDENDPRELGIPTNITYSIDSDEIVFNWDEVTGAESYDVEINSSLQDNITVTEYVYNNIRPEDEYAFRVRSVNSSTKSEWSEEVIAQISDGLPIEEEPIVKQDPVIGNGNGLEGEYYDSRTLKKLAFIRKDREINFDWGTGTPDPSIKKNAYSIRWTGKLLAEHTATYTIYTYTGDGVRLWLDDELIIDDWKSSATRENKAKVNLTAGQKYDIKIEYFNNNKEAIAILSWESAYKDKEVIPMQQLFCKPDTPANISTLAEGSKIIVSWDNTPGAEGYELEVDGASVNVGMEAQFEHEGLIPNTQHTYRVRAVNELGKGEWSDTFTKTSAPGIPSNVTLDATDTTITVVWDAVEAAEAYEIETDGEIVENRNNTSYTHSNLIPNSEHKYRIRSLNTNGKGEWSEVYSRYTLPDTPKNFTTAVTSNTITINWDAVPGALSYEIETDGEVKNIGLETTYTHRGLRPNTEHVYRVRAIGLGGTGYWSTEVIASTMLAVPQNIAAKATSSAIALTWDSVVDAQYYDVEADGNVIDNGGSIAFTHSNLAPNVEHTYRVRAREDLGAGDWSEPLKIKTLLETPVNLQAKATDITITITWDSVVGATSYDVELLGVKTVKFSGPEGVIDGLKPNTRYSYRVMARCEGNESEWSIEHSIITLLEAPSNITFESSSTITEIKWDTVNNADRYEIEVDGIVLDNGMATSYTHNGLEPNSLYKYRVRAINSNGIGVWSELLLKTTAPHIPLNLSAVSTSKTNTLSWDLVEGAESYEVEADGEIVINTSDTAFVHTDISPNSEHGYRVRAINVNGKGDWSELLSKTTAPHSPANINAFSSSTKIKFTWEEVYESQYYEIEIDDKLLTNTTETSYLYSGLLPNSEHKFRIRAVNTNGTGDWSGYVNKYTAPDIPVNLSAVSTPNSITITWSAVEAAEGYDIEINGTAVDVGNSTTYIHTGLNPNTQRAYKVRAKNANGIGDWSKVIAKITLPDTPSNISAEAAETAVTLRWDPIAGADQYDIMINSSILESTTVTEFVYGGLTPNTEYSFNIRAKNAEGSGNWSETITKKTMLGAPQGFAALAAETYVTLTWQSLSEGTAYDVEADGTIIDNGVGTSFVHQNLMSNTQHIYRVRAKTESSVSRWSEPLPVYTLPIVPINLKVVAYSNEIDVAWDMVEGVIGYELESDGTIIETGLANTYQHLNLTPNSTHIYRVRTVAEGGRSAWSDEVIADTLLGIPQNITTSVSNNSAALTWDTVEGATSYEVEADGIITPVIGSTSYTHAGLNANSVHVYRVRAKNGEIKGEWSTSVTALTMLNVPSNIKILPTANAITLTWDAVADAESYEVETNGTVVNDIKGTMYQLVGLTPNTEYIIRVKARNEMNASDWSANINQFTTPEIPQNLKATSTIDSTTVVWDAVYEAVGYDIEADGIVIDTGVQTTYTNAELTPNTQHVYRVRAKNASVVSKWSIPLTENTLPEMKVSFAAEESFNFVVVAPKKADLNLRTITVKYNPDELEVLDIYAATPGADLAEGKIQGTDFTVTQFIPGKIVLTVENATKTTMNIIKFKAKANLNTNISYEIE